MEQATTDEYGTLEVHVKTELTVKMCKSLMEQVRNACENFGVVAMVRNVTTDEKIKTR